MKSRIPIQPPKVLLGIFQGFCRPEYHEDIEGDLLELYAERARELGLLKARIWLFWDILILFRPGIIRPLFTSTHTLINPAMFKHNFLITYRNFLRNKRSFLINLLGLTTGLTCAILIFLWVQDEWNMDKFHEKDDQLYQVMQVYEVGEGEEVFPFTPGPLAKALKETFPEVEYAAATKQTSDWYDGILTFEEDAVKVTPMYADTDFFDIFSYPLLHGDKHQVLSDIHGAVISEKLAKRFFSTTEQAIGKTINWSKKMGSIVDYSGDFLIKGVFKDIPQNTTSQFDVIFTYEFFHTAEKGNVDIWDNDATSTHVILKKGANIDTLNKKMTELVAANRNWKYEFFFQQYSSKYLYGNYENGAQAGGRIQYVKLFSVIALLILLIASINFMNLSTARASIRVKEIGVKKTLGARRKSLIVQFVMESLIITFIALLLAVLAVELLIPQFNELTGKQLALQVDLSFMLSLIGIATFTGLLSSIYPALYLSGFNPIQVLKGKLSVSWGEFWVRRGLVVFQFAISVILIVSVWVIYKQMQFIQTQNLGYDRENILTVKRDGKLEDELETFLHEVRQLPQVVSATSSNNHLVDNGGWTGNIGWEGRPDEFVIDVFITNYDYLETYGISMHEGRDFSREFATDTAKVLINQTAVDAMGFEEPIGQSLTFWGKPVQIIGITKDFRYHSMYKEIRPCIFRLFHPSENFGELISIKMQAGMEKEAIAGVSNIYDQFNPGLPMEYGFVDQEYQTLYEAESRIASLSKYFAGLAILISCLGLFGLTLFTARRRAKEISIRKILGSSVWGIVGLLSKEFQTLLVVAAVIAIPISYLLAKNWLGEFAYRIELQWWFFAGAAALIFVIGWITVGFQTLKVAHLNPVEYLRDE